MTAPVATAPSEDEGAGSVVFVWIGSHLRVGPRRAEHLLGGLLALLAVGVTAYLARDMWFGIDEWEFLSNRTAFDPGDLTRPYGGHWTTWSVLLLRATYRAVGVDFWPWFYIPRLIGHTLLVTLMWRVMRRRGADPLVAMVAYAVLLVLGVSGYQRALQVGNWVVYASLIIAALVIADRERPTTRDKLLVSVVLLVGVLGNGYAVAVLGGIIGALLLARRLVAWLPSLVPPVFAYGAWYLVYRDDLAQGPGLLQRLGGIPVGVYQLLRTAVESTTALPGALAGLVVLGLVLWVATLVVGGRLDLFDAILLCTLACGMLLIAVQRISVEDESATRFRYGYSVLILASLALVPHVRIRPGRAGPVAVVIIGICLVWANLHQMKTVLDNKAELGQQARALTQAAAGMIDAGEPVVAGPSTVVRGLDLTDLEHLMDDGYHPGPLPADEPDRVEAMATARGALRMSIVDQRFRGPGVPGAVVAPRGTALDARGCATLSEDEPLVTSVVAPGELTVTKDPDQSVQLVWTDDFGQGVRYFDDPTISEGSIELAAPTSTTTLRLESEIGDVDVCGLVAAP